MANTILFIPILTILCIGLNRVEGEGDSISDLSLLIVGGEDVDGRLMYETELICYPEKQKDQHNSFLSNKNSSVPDFPLPSSGLIGSVLSGVPLFCGGNDCYGKYVSTCTELSQEGHWKISPSMNYKRGFFSSTLTRHGLIVAGGYPIRPPDSPLKTVEGVTSDNSSWILKNELTTENVGGCLSTLNEETIVLTGGSNLNPSIATNKVWVNQLEVDEWSAGPAMSISRYFHGCASFKDQHDGKNKIIVAGGVTSINGKDKTLKSSEIFDGEEWQRGPDLPQEMCCGQIVTSLNNEKVLWIGGGDIVGEGNGISYSIYELSNALDEWIELPQKMITGRIFFAAVDVPDMC